IEQDVVDEVERRVFAECRFENLLEGLALRPFAQGFFAVDDAMFQTLFGGKSGDILLGRLGRALEASKVRQVLLQRITSRSIVKNELAGEFNFLLRNLVQEIDLAVVNNGHIE